MREAVELLKTAAQGDPRNALTWLAKAHLALSERLGTAEAANARLHRLGAAEAAEAALALDADEGLPVWMDVIEGASFEALAHDEREETIRHIALLVRRLDELEGVLVDHAALASRLSGTVSVAVQCGVFDAARRIHDAALKIVEAAYEKDPSSSAHELAIVQINSTAACARAFHEPEQAKVHAQRAIMALESLYGLEPTAYAGMLASALDNRALTLDTREAWDERLILQRRAVDLFDEAVGENPRRWRSERITALRNLVKSHLSAGQLQDLNPLLARLRACYDIENDPLAVLRNDEIFWSLGFLGTFAARAGQLDDGARAYAEVELVLDRIACEGAPSPVGDEAIAIAAALGSAARMHEIAGRMGRADELLGRAIGILAEREDQEAAHLREQLRTHRAGLKHLGGTGGTRAS
jgi:tetratricopeptide (TPR) repeat protein